MITDHAIMWDVEAIDVSELIRELVEARQWAALWKQTAKEGRRTILMLLDELEQYQSVDVPVLGTLSANTTPDDFVRYTNGPD